MNQNYGGLLKILNPDPGAEKAFINCSDDRRGAFFEGVLRINDREQTKHFLCFDEYFTFQEIVFFCSAIAGTVGHRYYSRYGVRYLLTGTVLHYKYRYCSKRMGLEAVKSSSVTALESYDYTSYKQCCGS
jgi:hypothetical protein